MNKLNIKIVILVISILFFIGAIGLMVFMSQIDKQTEDTTTHYTATVTETWINSIGNSIYAEIHTKEYTNALQISTNISKNINMNDVKDLKSGQKIFFRIENIKSDQMNQVDFINIVSLKTETKDIFSLEDYNRYICNAVYPARIASVALVLLFLFISLFFFFSIKRKKNIKN